MNHTGNSQSTPQLFDIATVEDAHEAEVQLKRNGVPMPLFVTMAGPEHQIRKAAQFARTRRMRKAMMSGKQAFSDPVEEVGEEDEQIAQAVSGWRGFVLNGQSLTFSREALLSLLRDPKRQWLRKAMVEAYNDAEAFIVASAQS